jgi:hypothetical protein
VKFFTSQPSGYLDCNGGTEISVSLNNTTFCNTGTYTSSYFTSLGTNTFWLAYDGNFVQIFHNSNANTASRSNSCQACNSTPATATPLPATATPLPATATPLPPTAEPTQEPTPTPEPDPATPTPTPEPTATPVPVDHYSYQIGVDQSNRTNACSAFEFDPQTEVFAAESDPGSVSRFYTDTALTTGFFGSSDVYAYAPSTNLSNVYTTNVNSIGQSTTSREACP